MLLRHLQLCQHEREDVYSTEGGQLVCGGCPATGGWSQGKWGCCKLSSRCSSVFRPLVLTVSQQTSVSYQPTVSLSVGCKHNYRNIHAQSTLLDKLECWIIDSIQFFMLLGECNFYSKILIHQSICRKTILFIYIRFYCKDLNWFTYKFCKV